MFTTGDAEKLVYCSAEGADQLPRQLGCSVVVIGTGAHVDMERVGRDLSDRGVGRLMIEGGGHSVPHGRVDAASTQGLQTAGRTRIGMSAR